LFFTTTRLWRWAGGRPTRSMSAMSTATSLFGHAEFFLLLTFCIFVCAFFVEHIGSLESFAATSLGCSRSLDECPPVRSGYRHRFATWVTSLAGPLRWPVGTCIMSR
jgi:hypothetical protein